MQAEAKLPNEVDYLAQYSGMALFFRAETIAARFPTMKRSALEYAINRESESKLIFKLEEAAKSLNKIFDESSLAARKSQFEKELTLAKQATNNASRVSDKPAIISTHVELAKLYLEYGLVSEALAVLRNVRSYVSISSAPGILSLLKQIQFYARADEELAVVPAIYLQSYQGNRSLTSRR